MLIGCVFLLIISWILLTLGIFRQIKRNEILEDANLTYDEYFNNLQGQLVSVLKTIRSIDLRGAFEAEDEVGDVFKGIKNAIETLNTFVVEENNDTTKNNKQEPIKN